VQQDSAGAPGGAYREPPAAQAQAVELLRRAEVLYESYVDHVRRMGSLTAYEIDDLTQPLDQLYAALWDHLRQARGLLRSVGHDLSAYDAISADQQDQCSGYQAEVVSSGLLGELVGLEDKVVARVDAAQVTRVRAALDAIEALLPTCDFRSADDPDVMQTLSRQRRRRTAWLAACWLVGALVVVFVLRVIAC